MNSKTFTMYKPRETWLRVLCIACLLSICIIVHNRLIQPLSGRLSDNGSTDLMTMTKTRLEETLDVTPCAPVGQYDQFNPCLVKYVQQNMLLPPSGLPLSIRETPELGVAVEVKVNFIKKHFITENSPPGFFIECGANDGTYISPTFMLEREFNWTGVLIEADPIPFKKLVASHRNAWKMHAALCPKPNSEMVTFYSRPMDTSISGLQPGSGTKEVEVPCVPLYTILAAMGIRTVDFFSLDVEGAELDVLKTVPYDKVIFKLLIVEHDHSPGHQPPLINLLEHNGYVFIGSLIGPKMRDSLFVHESVYTSNMSLEIKYNTEFQ